MSLHRRSGKVGLAAMLLAVLVLSLQAVLASLAMAAASPAVEECHRQAGTVSDGHAMTHGSESSEDGVAHAHSRAAPAKSPRTEGEGGMQHACCTPVGLAVLPEGLRLPQGVERPRLAPPLALTPPSYSPEAPGKPPRTIDQV